EARGRPDLRHPRVARNRLTVAGDAALLRQGPGGRARLVARVALVGNPNTGKTTLFNRLCGVRAKTSNFPGTTTTMRVGQHLRGDGFGWDVVDLPGVYGLGYDGPEARIVRDILHGEGGQQS